MIRVKRINELWLVSIQHNGIYEICGVGFSTMIALASAMKYYRAKYNLAALAGTSNDPSAKVRGIELA